MERLSDHTDSMRRIFGDPDIRQTEVGATDIRLIHLATQKIALDSVRKDADEFDGYYATIKS